MPLGVALGGAGVATRAAAQTMGKMATRTAPSTRPPTQQSSGAPGVPGASNWGPATPPPSTYKPGSTSDPGGGRVQPQYRPDSSFDPGGSSLLPQQQPRGSGPSGIPLATMDPYVQWAQGQTAINNSMAQLTQAGYDLQGSQAYANYGQGIGGLAAQAGFDQSYLNSDKTRLAADQSLWGAKNANLDTQWDISNKRYTNQTDQNNDRRALSGRTFENNNSVAGLNYDRTNRQVLSDNTARGATLTQGFTDTNAETGRTRDNALASNQIGYDTNMNDLQWADEANWRTFRSDDANHNLATAQQQRESTYLSALGDDYGIKEDQIADALKRGVAKLGLDYSSTIDQLANLKAQGTAQSLAQASALSYQLLNANLGVSGTNALGAQVGAPAPAAAPAPPPPPDAGSPGSIIQTGLGLAGKIVPALNRIPGASTGVVGPKIVPKAAPKAAPRGKFY